MATSTTKSTTSNADLLAQIETLRAQNAALIEQQAHKGSGKISFKVSEKGGLSVYGLGRFPVTLYKEQWEKLNSEMHNLLAFAKAHDSQLSTKADKIARDVQSEVAQRLAASVSK